MGMKVGNVGQFDREPRVEQDALPRAAAEGRAVVFKKTLTELSREQHTTHMKELARDIGEQGERLARRPDVKELERYRSMIRDFIGEVVSNGYEFSKESGYAQRGRRQVLATVKTINEKLDELAKEVLEGQAEAISLLEKTGDIQGLLLDMML